MIGSSLLAEASPEFRALIETEQALLAECKRAEDAPQHEYDAHHSRWWQAYEAVEAFPPRALADLAMKALVIAEVHKENDKENMFRGVVRDICALVGITPPNFPDD
jgi:hypothetical protein